MNVLKNPAVVETSCIKSLLFWNQMKEFRDASRCRRCPKPVQMWLLAVGEQVCLFGDHPPPSSTWVEILKEKRKVTVTGLILAPLELLRNSRRPKR